MIQTKTSNTKKTVLSFAIILVMVGGMLVLLLGRSGGSSSSGDSLQPALLQNQAAGGSGIHFEKNIFEQKDFFSLIQQSSLPDVTEDSKGRPNPFVPLFPVKSKQ